MSKKTLWELRCRECKTTGMDIEKYGENLYLLSCRNKDCGHTVWVEYKPFLVPVSVTTPKDKAKKERQKRIGRWRRRNNLSSEDWNEYVR